MQSDRFDAIVVGAGPAGSTASLEMAKNNMSVLIIERGKFPGSKNVFGGAVYSEPTELIVPAFWEEAPIEVPIVKDELWAMDVTSAVNFGFTGLNYGKPPYNKFTVKRAKWDNWLAKKAEKAGAKLLNEALVTDLVYEKKSILGKRVSGVVLDNKERIYSDIVILAEGANAYLTQEAGMRNIKETSELFLYAKEELEIPKRKIQDRFSLNEGEGANIVCIGFPAGTAVGKGGIFTFKNSITIMIGAYLNQLISQNLNPYDLLVRFKKHPLINRMINGAKPYQYMAKTIPKAGYTKIPTLYDDSLLIVGDAAGYISGRRGMDLAMISGKYAGETAVQAKSKDDFSKNILKTYNDKIQNSFFMKNIKDRKKASNYYSSHTDSDFLLAKLMNDMAYEFFKEDLSTAGEKMNKVMKEIEHLQPARKTISDLFYGIREWKVL